MQSEADADRARHIDRGAAAATPAIPMHIPEDHYFDKHSEVESAYLSANNVRNAHFVVINDIRKVVRRKRVRLEQHRVRRQRCVRVAYAPEYEIRGAVAYWAFRVLSCMCNECASSKRLLRRTLRRTMWRSPARTRRTASSSVMARHALS